MIQCLVGTELTRPFLPSKDFELSERFYEALGFEKLLDADVAIFRMGRGEFLLQSYYQKEWAENFMMQLMVDDLDAWWTQIQSLDLPGNFRVAPPKAPALQPRSEEHTSELQSLMRISYAVFCLKKNNNK